MKIIRFHFLLSFFMLLPFIGRTQEIPDIPLISGVVSYTETIDTDLSANEMYKNLKVWAATEFDSQQTSFRLDDIDLGKVIFECTVYPYFQFLGQRRESIIKYVMEVDLKDNRYRYKLNVAEHFHKQTTQTIPELIQIAHKAKKPLTTTRSYAIKQLWLINDSALDITESLKNKMVFVDDF